MGKLVDLQGKSLEPKPTKKKIVYIISHPIKDIANAEVHVHKEEFEYADDLHLLGLIGDFITKLAAKDANSELMIFPLNERKFLGVQEMLCRMNNQVAKEVPAKAAAVEVGDVPYTLNELLEFQKEKGYQVLALDQEGIMQELADWKG